jgi:hypothetical protein
MVCLTTTTLLSRVMSSWAQLLLLMALVRWLLLLTCWTSLTSKPVMTSVVMHVRVPLTLVPLLLQSLSLLVALVVSKVAMVLVLEPTLVLKTVMRSLLAAAATASAEPASARVSLPHSLLVVRQGSSWKQLESSVLFQHDAPAVRCPVGTL